MSLFPNEDILTKEIESWKGFADSLPSEEDRTTFTKMLNECYKYVKAINAKAQPFPAHVLVACPGITPIPTSGGVKGSGSTCGAGNCTSATPPPVDCTKNPTEPSCTQTLTPSTTSPTTTTCPDGSVIDVGANCPTQSISPSTSG